MVVDANCLAWDWSGIPKYVDRIVRELAGQLDFELLANADGPFTDIPGVRQGFRRIRGGVAWRHGFVLPRLLRSRPDVFWAPQTLMPVRVPVPSVATVHDLAPLLFPGTKPWRETLSYRTSLPRSTRAATRVIAVSETTASDVEREWRVPRERLRVAGNGVDEAFTPGDRDAARAAVAARWEIAGPYVLHVGTLDPRKGLEVLFEAAAAAHAAGDGWMLVLAGSPGFRGAAQLAGLAGAPWCRALGRVSDAELADLYRAADAVAAPALYEGFGIVPLEAMACGTPVVVAAGSGALEEISGPAAVIAAERTEECWRRAISQARARRAELAPAGLALAAQHRWPEVAARTREVLLEAAASRR